ITYIARAVAHLGILHKLLNETVDCVFVQDRIVKACLPLEAVDEQHVSRIKIVGLERYRPLVCNVRSAREPNERERACPTSGRAHIVSELFLRCGARLEVKHVHSVLLHRREERLIDGCVGDSEHRRRECEYVNASVLVDHAGKRALLLLDSREARGKDLTERWFIEHPANATQVQTEPLDEPFDPSTMGHSSSVSHTNSHPAVSDTDIYDKRVLHQDRTSDIVHRTI